MTKEMIMVYLPTIFIMSPLFITGIFYVICKQLFRHQWRAIHFTVQCTAIFYIIAVEMILYRLFAQRFIGIILIACIVLLAITLIIQWKRDTDVVLRDGIKIVLRISFLVFFLLYFLFGGMLIFSQYM